MDASAYLRRQGWLGDGHSLDHTAGRTGTGIKKPLLVSKKVDVLGVGLNKHTVVSDQWWLRAFDQGLKDLGSGKESALASVQKHGIHRGGLYGRFVRGEGVPGTFGADTPTSTSTGASTPVEGEQRVMSTEQANSGKMPDRKRKRDEPSEEVKRAKRKVEKQDKTKQEKSIDRRAKDVVLEAQKQGIIPAGPNEGRKRSNGDTGKPPVAAEVLAQLTASAAFQKHRHAAARGPEKTRKFARETMKRVLKRAAKNYITTGQVKEPKAKQERKTRSKAKPAGFEEEDENDMPAQVASQAEVDAIIKALVPGKLELYEKRARQKSLSIEDYVRRREEKRGSRPAKDTEGRQSAATSSNNEPNDIGFVVDTEGDASLGASRAKSKKSVKSASFAQDALSAIAAGEVFNFEGDEDEEPFEWEPKTPVPMDPRLWTGIDAKMLPRSVRRARKEWMAVRRAERKEDPIHAAKKEKKSKDRGQRKVEAREDLVNSILRESRKYFRTQPAGDQASETYATIEGVEKVPLVKLESTGGKYSKGDIALARTVARRVQRNVKRADRAEKGKAKGWKKRERAQKEAESKAGILGSVPE